MQEWQQTVQCRCKMLNHIHVCIQQMCAQSNKDRSFLHSDNEDDNNALTNNDYHGLLRQRGQTDLFSMPVDGHVT